jgi:hypothetical protein
MSTKRKPSLTFKTEDQGFFRYPRKVRAQRGGKLLANISFSGNGNRYYWYAMDRGPGQPPHNTLGIEGSATTLDGCKEEIREFFKDE